MSIQARNVKSGTDFAIYRRIQRIEKIRKKYEAILDFAAGVYCDDFENTANRLDKLLEQLESDLAETVDLTFKTLGRLLVDHADRQK